MMKIADLPIVFSRIGQFLLDPRQLLRIQVRAVQNEEVDVAFLEGMISLPVHVEEFVEALIGIVVVSQSRVELYTRVQKRFIRDLELLLKVERTLASVNVVAQHQHESEWELLVKLQHAFRDLVLGWFPRAHIPNGREAD